MIIYYLLKWSHKYNCPKARWSSLLKSQSLRSSNHETKQLQRFDEGKFLKAPDNCCLRYEWRSLRWSLIEHLSRRRRNVDARIVTSVRPTWTKSQIKTNKHKSNQKYFAQCPPLLCRLSIIIVMKCDFVTFLLCCWHYCILILMYIKYIYHSHYIEMSTNLNIHKNLNNHGIKHYSIE